MKTKYIKKEQYLEVRINMIDNIWDLPPSFEKEEIENSKDYLKYSENKEVRLLELFRKETGRDFLGIRQFKGKNKCLEKISSTSPEVLILVAFMRAEEIYQCYTQKKKIQFKLGDRVLAIDFSLPIVQEKEAGSFEVGFYGEYLSITSRNENSSLLVAIDFKHKQSRIRKITNKEA